MSHTAPPRTPQLFDPDDPGLLPEPLPGDLTERQPPLPHAPPSQEGLMRPTLAAIGRGSFRWGALFLSAVTGAATLALTAWGMRLLAAALARDDWLGWSTLTLISIAAFAALMLLLRELIGFTRLARLNRLRREVAAARGSGDPRREREAALSLVRLYRGRADTAWGVRRFAEHAQDVRDAGELLQLAEREVLVPLDTEARRLVLISAKRVATVTALSPLLLIAVGYVLIECVRMLRVLASLYGGRPGVLGALRLARMVLTHILATGGLAMTDDLIGQFLGQDLLRRLSRRLGEGAFNGALTARVGVAAVEVIRPLPYLAAKPLRVRDLVADVVKPLFAGR